MAKRRLLWSSLLLLPLALPIAMSVAACGGRGPLEIDTDTLDAGDQDATNGLDATTQSDGEIPDATPSTDATTRTDARAVDAGRDAGGFTIDTGIPIVNCGLCVAQSCGQDLLACIQSVPCRTTLQCVTTTCLGGGTPDPACVLKCSNGDTTALLQIFKVFQCIVSNCGQSCLALLGGTPGRDAGNAPKGDEPLQSRREIVDEAFSAFPEVCSSSAQAE